MGKIRLAQVKSPGSLEQIDALDRKIFAGDVPVCQPGSFWWLLTDDGEPIGFCGVRVLDSGSSGFLYRAGIIPAYRGQGLHKRLILARERWCRKNQLKYCVTYVLPSNTQSLNNLLKAGYKAYKPKYLFGGSINDVIYLRKRL